MFMRAYLCHPKTHKYWTIDYRRQRGKRAEKVPKKEDLTNSQKKRKPPILLPSLILIIQQSAQKREGREQNILTTPELCHWGRERQCKITVRPVNSLHEMRTGERRYIASGVGRKKKRVEQPNEGRTDLRKARLPYGCFSGILQNRQVKKKTKN